MELSKVVSLYGLLTLFHLVCINGLSINNCDGMMCPENTYCSVTSTTVDGKQQTTRTCSNTEGQVVARSFTSGDAGLGSRRSNVVQSSNYVMSGGGGSCVQQSSSVDGINTLTYHCSNGNGNYYVTNINGVYKNCTSVPVAQDSGVTTMQEQCVPMTPEDIERVKQMEAEIRQRMEGMATRMHAQTQEIQNRMMHNMENMRQNMQNTFGSMFNGFGF